MIFRNLKCWFRLYRWSGSKMSLEMAFFKFWGNLKTFHYFWQTVPKARTRCTGSFKRIRRDLASRIFYFENIFAEENFPKFSKKSRFFPGFLRFPKFQNQIFQKITEISNFEIFDFLENIFWNFDFLTQNWFFRFRFSY